MCEPADNFTFPNRIVRISTSREEVVVGGAGRRRPLRHFRREARASGRASGRVTGPFSLHFQPIYCYKLRPLVGQYRWLLKPLLGLILGVHL